MLFSIAATRFFRSSYPDRQLVLSFPAPGSLASVSEALRLGRQAGRLPEKALREHLAEISGKLDYNF